MKTQGTPDDPLQLVKAFSRHAPMGIQIFDERGYSLYVNKRYLRMFGAPPAKGYCCLADKKRYSPRETELVCRAFAGQSAKLPTRYQGQKCVFQTNIVPILSAGGAVSHVMFLYKDPHFS